MRAKLGVGCLSLLCLVGCAELDSAMSAAIQAATTPPIWTENFESPVTNNYTVYKAGQSLTTATSHWQISAGSVDLVNAKVRTEVAAFDGNQVVDLAGSPGPGTMSTTIPSTPGQRYTLVFHYSRNNGIGGQAARATVEVIGRASLLRSEVQHSAPTPFNSYQRFSAPFVADSSSTTLRFTSLNSGNFGLVIDALSISAAPSAATGWHRYVGRVLPDGSIEQRRPDHPIGSNIKTAALTRRP